MSSSSSSAHCHFICAGNARPPVHGAVLFFTLSLPHLPGQDSTIVDTMSSVHWGTACVCVVSEMRYSYCLPKLLQKDGSAPRANNVHKDSCGMECHHMDMRELNNWNHKPHRSLVKMITQLLIVSCCFSSFPFCTPTRANHL